MKRKWTDLRALIDDVKKLIEEDKSNKEIGEALGLQKYQVLRIKKYIKEGKDEPESLDLDSEPDAYEELLSADEEEFDMFQWRMQVRQRKRKPLPKVIIDGKSYTDITSLIVDCGEA